AAACPLSRRGFPGRRFRQSQAEFCLAEIQPALYARATVFVPMHNEVEASVPVTVRRVQWHERAAAERFLQGNTGQAANAEPCLDRALDRFRMLEFQTQ